MPPGRSAKAAPIRPRVEARKNLLQFWAAGPSRWSTTDPTPRFPSIRVITEPNGDLRKTPLVKALDARRDRNPSRFDRGYFRISPLFQRQDAPPAVPEVREYLVRFALPRTAAFQILIPPGGEDSPILAEQNFAAELSPAPAPAPVPEPASLATTLVLFAVAGGWWSRRR